MSVRASERLIGDLVIVSALPNSPQMIVKTIDPLTKLVTTSWFSDSSEYQEGFFPYKALERVDTKKNTQTSTKKKSRKPPAKR